MGEQDKKGNQIPLNQQNIEPVEAINPWQGVEERIIPLFNEAMDQHVQSQALGLSIVDEINRKRKLDGRNELQWYDGWHNIAFKVSEDNSEGVSISLQEQIYKTSMEESFEMLDPEVETVIVDANHSPIDRALEILDGGERNTQTHITIGIYQRNNRAYFTQLTGREIEGGKFSNTWDKSVAWGKKALDEINFHRAQNQI